MERSYLSAGMDLTPYVPQSLSEIYDLLGSMWLSAPTFVDESGWFPERDIDMRFHQLTAGFEVVRAKLGEGRHAALIELAARAKQLFAADPSDDNGKSDEGRTLLGEIEDLIRAAWAERSSAGERENDGA
jgi:hypothetical protein